MLHELSDESREIIERVFHAYNGNNDTIEEDEFYNFMKSIDAETTREDAQVCSLGLPSAALFVLDFLRFFSELCLLDSADNVSNFWG